MAAQRIFYNGKIATNSTPSFVEAMAIENGKISAIGMRPEILNLRDARTEVVDLCGQTVIPGLNDSHLHIVRGGLHYNLELRWDGVPSLADALRMLREQAQRTPAPQWVRVVGGWNEFQFAERRMPSLEEINAVAPDTPVFVLHLYDRALLNAAALRAVGYTKDTPNPPGGEIQRDKRGNPTGLLIARPNAGILYATLAKGPLLPYEDQLTSTRHFMRELNRLGVTSAIDAGGGFQNYPDDYRVISELHRRGQMTVRVAYNLFTQRPKHELDDFRNWTSSTSLYQGDRTLLAASPIRMLLAQQIAHGPAPVAPDRSYKLLRSDEDWSFLRDRNLRSDVWDPIKYIPLRKTGQNWFVTLGGEARETWEQIGNDNWGQSPIMNGYLNERYMTYADFHFGPHVRTFLELKSGLNSFRAGGPRPIDEKRLDFQSGFLEVSGGTSWGSVRVRAGRQEMEFGSGRLVDVREGPNVRLSFDGFLVRTKIYTWQIDGFAMRPDEDNPGFFDNAPDHAVGFCGAYATGQIPGRMQLDLYYLGQDRKDGTFERGTAHENRHSLGVRISKPTANEHSGWDFDDEAVWQFGSFGAADIRAWTVATETGYRIPTIPLKPRFSAKADISSGDHPGTNRLGTFNPLYPKGNYFGVLATTGPGPINFIDVHPHVEASIPRNVSLSFDWIFQWRQSLDDGVYAVPGFLIRAADGNRSRFVGNRPGTEIRWQANDHLWFQGDYGIFYAGRFLKETQPGRDLNYWALWTGYRF